MNVFRGNPEDLAAAAASWEEKAGAFRGLTNQLSELVEEAKTQWQGGASRSFADVATRWNEAMSQSTGTLDRFSETFNTASAKYASTEENNKESFAMNFGEDTFSDGRNSGDKTDDGKAGDGKTTTEAAQPVDFKEDVGDGADGTDPDAAPTGQQGKLGPLEPGKSEFVGDIASSRDAKGHGGIKGADLGVPATLKDGTPIMLFGDCNKPGDKGNEYRDSIIAAGVDNTPDGVKVTGIDGWGAGELLKEQATGDERSYPQGVIKLEDRELLTVGNVHTVGAGTANEDDFAAVSSHMVEIGGKEGGWPTVDHTRLEKDAPSYATGMQDGNTVYIAGCSGHGGDTTLYAVPVAEVTDRGNWSNYAVGTVPGADATPQMSKIGDQYYLSYMGEGGLSVMIADSPADFANGVARSQHVPLPEFPLAEGAAYGGYILPNSTPDDLRFAVSYFGEGGVPYGVGEYRYRPR